MATQLSILNDISAEQFLAEYWQKKPLLIRNAIPEIVGMFEPDDILELALDEYITARLLTQHGDTQQQWQVKNSPLQSEDFAALPPLWTLLVQAVDHYSIELAALWDKFSFIPKWRRDDIMVSYAPKGGSVGQHFDFYDVFLLQGHGHRRWQLGQWCDENTAFVPDQPLRLLEAMQVTFDEVLAPGDLLYVPPKLAHYGVAEDDCLTFSFGFRMPNQTDLIDQLSDKFAEQEHAQTPLPDAQRLLSSAVGEVTTTELKQLKETILTAIQDSAYFEQAVMALVSEAKYPNNIPELEPMSLSELQDMAQESTFIGLEPASRLLYRQVNTELEFWANGEVLCIHPDTQPILKQLADGVALDLGTVLQQHVLEDLLMAINHAVLILIDHDDMN